MSWSPGLTKLSKTSRPLVGWRLRLSGRTLREKSFPRKTLLLRKPTLRGWQSRSARDLGIRDVPLEAEVERARSRRLGLDVEAPAEVELRPQGVRPLREGARVL